MLMRVLVGMGMRVPMRVFMAMHMGVAMFVSMGVVVDIPVLVCMSVGVSVLSLAVTVMAVLMAVPMRVRLGMNRRRLLREHLAFQYIKLPTRDAATQHVGEPAFHTVQAELGRQGLHVRLASRELRRSGHKHVAADATVQVQDENVSAHDACLKSPSMRRAAIAAPQPLSMFITTTPEAQLANMALSAALPPSATP